MKYLVALLLGLFAGAALFILGLAYNPFASKPALSPLAGSDSQTITLGYSAVASDAIMFTNDGEAGASPHPEKVQQLWEAPVRQTDVIATVLRDERNQVAGLGIKFSSVSESTRLFEGRVLIDSIWYVHLPGRGSFYVEQTENYWDYLRDVVLPAYRDSAKTWKGIWTGNITVGPGSSGTGRVVGGSGEFDGLEMQAVESLTVRIWRVSGGPLASDGQLTVALPASSTTP
jgi:hypothetical protein